MVKGLFESENVAAPHIEEKEIPTGECYRARFIVSGPVGYADGVYFLPQHALDDFAYTMKGKPVIVGHQDIINETDMKKKAVGYVSGVDRDEEGGWWANFVIFDSEAIKMVDNGSVPYVSCGYKAELCEEDLTINNVKYKKKITGGEMLHLALVKNPRYNGTEVWRNSTDEVFVGEGTLYNKKDSTMHLFKKIKQEIDKDLLVNTADGELTIEELVNCLEEAKAEIAEKDKIIAEQAAKIEELQPKAEEVVEEKTAEAAEEIQPKVEEAPAEVEAVKPEDTDAGFKEDLNNSLTEEVKKIVIQVPDVSI